MTRSPRHTDRASLARGPGWNKLLRGGDPIARLICILRWRPDISAPPRRLKPDRSGRRRCWDFARASSGRSLLPAQAYLPLAKENPGRKGRADPPERKRPRPPVPVWLWRSLLFLCTHWPTGDALVRNGGAGG